MGESGQVIELRRVRLADATPVAVETAVLAPHCSDALRSADLAAGSLHEAVIGAGIVPTRGSATIRAEAATGEDACLLGVHAGDPMLVETRLILDQRGRPMEYGPNHATRPTATHSMWVCRGGRGGSRVDAGGSGA